MSGVAPNYVQTPISRDELAFDPDFLAKDNDLYRDLSTDVEMVSLGVDLSRSASSVISESIVATLPYLLMLVVVLLTSLYQQRQIQGRQSAAAVNPQQQMMMKLIPYMLPVFSYVMPAAVVTYFIVSNMVRIAQQAYITRSFYRGEDSLGAQVAKQRAAAETDGTGTAGSQARSPKSVTEGKGAPTPRRDAKPSKAKAPARKRTQGTDKAPMRRRTSPQAGTTDKTGSTGVRDIRKPPQARTTERRGRTGKAPSRGRSGSRPGGGRVTPPGSGPKRPSQNRSRSKRKRR